MTLHEAATRLVQAIEHAVQQHGRPNSFGFEELNTFNGGPGQMIAGRAARRHPELLAAIGAHVDGRRVVVESVNA
jgi:hypothetical protein